MNNKDFLLQQLGITLLVGSIGGIGLTLSLREFIPIIWQWISHLSLVIAIIILVAQRHTLHEEPNKNQYKILGYIFLVITLVLARLTQLIKGQLSLEAIIPLVFSAEYFRRGFIKTKINWKNRLILTTTIATLMTIYVINTTITKPYPITLRWILLIIVAIIWGAIIFTATHHKNN